MNKDVEKIFRRGLESFEMHMESFLALITNSYNFVYYWGVFLQFSKNFIHLFTEITRFAPKK